MSLDYNYNIIIYGKYSFEWDEEKCKTNTTKHGVSFYEAATVFDDPNAKIIADPDHSDQEERFIILGLSNKLNLLAVVYCIRNIDKIRIISARKATKNEQRDYSGESN